MCLGLKKLVYGPRVVLPLLAAADVVCAGSGQGLVAAPAGQSPAGGGASARGHLQLPGTVGVLRPESLKPGLQSRLCAC